MRNPFTMLRSAVSRFFAPKPKPAPAAAPVSPFVVAAPAAPAGYTAPPAHFVEGYVPSQKLRNQRRSERQSVRLFVRRLNQARG